MTKIPVGKTITYAYGFTFGNFTNLLGVMWLPLVVMFVPSFLLSMYYNEQLVADAENPLAAFQLFPLMLPIYAIMYLVLATIYAAVTRAALGLGGEPRYVYFALDKSIWRLAGAYVILTVILIGVYMALIFAAALIGTIIGIAVGVSGGAGAEGEVPAIAGLLIFFFVLVILGAVLYLYLRLGFFLTPVVVVEEKIDFRRAWYLSDGNFWQMFGVTLGIVAPFFVVYLIYFYLFFGFDLFTAGIPLPGEDPEAIRQRGLEAQIAFNERANATWYISLPFGMLLAVVFYALGPAASAFAYRVLVPASAPRGL
jgi:hypothetical protein